MTYAPFFRFYVPRGAPPFDPSVISACERIPGVKTGNGGEYIQAPTNAAWLIEGMLRQYKLAFNPWSPKVQVHKWPAELRELVARGLRPVDPLTGISMDDFVSTYQKREVFRMIDHAACILNWPPGSGKSLGGMLYALGVDGPTVIVTGAKGRLQWRDQLRRYTIYEPELLLGAAYLQTVEIKVADGLTQIGARSLRDIYATRQILCSCGSNHPFELVRKTSDKGKTYKLIARLRLPSGQHKFASGDSFDVVVPEVNPTARFIVVGWETLPYHAAKIVKLKPATLILDESHKAKNHRRVEMVPVSEADLPQEPKAKQLEDGRWVKYVDLENMASATRHLAKASQRRCLLTATLIKDRVRDVWAQLDYAEPFGWGSYWPWAKRYAGAVKNSWGGMDDRGATNLDELNRRIAFVRSYVSVEEYAASMPAKRRDVIYLAPDAQQREDESFVGELAQAQLHRASLHSIANIKLAAACSRKRKAVVESVVEEVNGGAKCVIFTARHHDVDVLTALLKARVSKKVQLWHGDGRNSLEARHEMAQAYMAAPSHALLIATGDSFGEQLDLQDTDIFHFVMLPWTIAALVQWEGRGWRKGGRRNVLYKYWIAEGTFDEHVASILLSKLPAVDKIGMEGTFGLGADLKGNEEELIASLAQAIMSGTQGQIEHAGDDE